MLTSGLAKLFKGRMLVVAAGLFIVALVGLLTGQVYAKDYENRDGERGRFDLVIRLTGDTSKVSKVVAQRNPVAPYNESRYVNRYELRKTNASTYTQQHFQFLTDSVSCRDLPQSGTTGVNLSYSTKLYDFTVVAYDRSNNPISESKSIRLDYDADCGKDKRIDLAVTGQTVSADALGQLSGTVTVIENGQERAPDILSLSLKGKDGSTIQPHFLAQDKKSYRFINIPPGEYTLTGRVDNKDINTTGPINPGVTNKNDIVVHEGQVKFCGTDCDKQEFTASLVSGGGDDSATRDDNLLCETGGVLSWILCPVFNGIADFCDFLFTGLIVPLLQTDRIVLEDSNPLYNAWSNFRIYGNIFLLLALIIIVFGQSIGGGLVDAYTAKKVLPRLLIATILINLSIYIVALLVDFTNILGLGLGRLITEPIDNAGAFKFTPAGIEAGSIVGIGVGAGFAGIIAGLFKGALIKGLAIKALPFVLLFMALPLLIGLLITLIVLVIRDALIFALILISPVAFALYCLPNTEQYFKRWWKLLVQTLLVYPIVVVFFAAADVMSYTLASGDITVAANGAITTSANGGAIGLILAFLLQFIPLLFIPYAFRLAGGLLGRLNDFLVAGGKRSQEAVKGSQNDPNSLRNRVKRNFRSEVGRAQAQRYREFKNMGKEGTVRRAIGGRLATASTIFGDPLTREAGLIDEAKRRVQNVKDNGDDSILNAAASFIDPTDGKRKTLDGKVVNDADYRAARKFYPNLADVQAVAEYRAGKVLTTEDAHQFTRNYGHMAQQMGLSAEEASGAFTGLSFAKQNERGEWKHGKYVQSSDGSFEFQAVGDTSSFDGGSKSRAASFVKEQYAKRGTYEGAKMFSSYFQSMGDIKKHHIDKLEGFEAQRRGGATLSATEAANEQHSKEQLKQILEIQDQFSRGGRMQDPATGQMIDSGLAGASAETQAAFAKMVALDNVSMPAMATAGPSSPITPPAGATTPPATSPRLASSVTREVVANLKAEINRGETYEATRSPDYGDFTNR